MEAVQMSMPEVFCREDMKKRVKVIGEMTSFAIVYFDTYDQKRAFKDWLKEYGKKINKESGVWFGENINRDSRERERAVGKVTKALAMAKEGRGDVHRDYQRGIVYVGQEEVAKWDAEKKVMKFDGEGKQVRDVYKRLMVEGRREVEEEAFSE